MSKELIGKGRIASVYKEDNKAIKIFNKKFEKSMIEYEAEVSAYIFSTRLLVPKCYGLKEYEEGQAIVSEFIEGKELSYFIKTNIFSINKLGKNLADTLLNIHSIEVGEELNSINYKEILKNNNLIDQPTKSKLIQSIIETSEAYLCHGDFHPGNILVNNKGYYTIDWLTCYKGVRASDIARTLLILRSPIVKEYTPKRMHFILDIIMRKLEKSFLKRYLSNSNVNLDEINRWLPIIAALRLNEFIPCEKEWLLDLIHNSI